MYYDGQSRLVIVITTATCTTQYNLQGDVIALLDTANTIVVEYNYDAWGKLLGKTGTLAATLGTLNPFRYRGYVYDEETMLYYLRSRYYNPWSARFINADGWIGEAGAVFTHNLYAYCNNSPVRMKDDEGHAAVDATVAYGLAETVALADGPLPFGDIIAVIIIGIYFIRTITAQTGSAALPYEYVQPNTEDYISRNIEATIGGQVYTRNRIYNVHHIVARSAPQAAPAREVLQLLGIRVGDSENLVMLPQEIHARLHTNEYYGYVNARIIAAFCRGRDMEDKRKLVYRALKEIKYVLTIASLTTVL